MRELGRSRGIMDQSLTTICNFLNLKMMEYRSRQDQLLDEIGLLTPPKLVFEPQP